MDFLDGKILVSVSTEQVEKKDSDIWKTLHYRKTEIRLSKLTELIKQQYAFCGVFEESEFTQSQKIKSNWVGAYIVPIDLDERKLNYTQFLELIKESDIVPNLAYRTANDGTKGNRYRLLYCFDEMITNETLYKQIYDGIIRKIDELTSDKNKDNCGGVITQSFAGSDKIEDIFYNDFYYSVKWVKEIFGISTLNISDRHLREQEQKPIAKKRTTKFDNFDFFDYTLMYDEFANDYNKMRLMDLIQKYNTIYPNIESTPLKEENDDVAFIDIPNNYIEIKRYWFLTENGLNNNKLPTIRKISDGMGRRKKLFLNAIIRRLINNNISFDNLLFNIICEFSYYMINDGNKITKKDLFEITQRAFNADLSKYKKMIIGNKEKKFVVNPLYCIKHNISKQAGRNIAIKQRNAQKIGELYDLNLTDKENIEVMKSYGVEISLKTLRRWRTDNNITKGVVIQNYKEEERTLYNLNDHTPNNENNGLSKERNKSAKTNYKEEKRTLYTCNCTFSNNTNSMEQNKTDMEENKHDVRALNGGVEEMPIDEEINEQGVNKWGFRLVKYPVFAMVFDVLL